MNPKLWRPDEMNAWQFLALVGLVMTAAAHLLLRLSGRVIPDFPLLYLTWTGVFVLAAWRNIYGPPPDPDDHHH